MLLRSPAVQRSERQRRSARQIRRRPLRPRPLQDLTVTAARILATTRAALSQARRNDT